MMNKLKLGLIILIIISLGVGSIFVLSRRGKPLPEGASEDKGGKGLPLMRQELREALEEVFTQHNDAVPKNTLIAKLEELGKTLTGDKGPAAHQISVTYPSDGLHFEYRGDPDEHGFIAEKATEGIIKHASVPDAVVDPKTNKIRLYFVDSDATRKMIAAVKTLSKDTVSKNDLATLYENGYFRDNNPFSMAEQTDNKGEKFEVKALRILDFPDDLSAADPSIVLAEDNGYRLYFFCVPTAEIPQGGDIAAAATHYVGYAASDDGQTFRYGGTVYDRKGPGLTDPEVYRFGSDYKLFLQGSKIRVVSSTGGGKTFTSQEEELDLSSGDYAVGGPSVRISEVGGLYRMYFAAVYGKDTVFTASASSKDGSNWTFNPLPKIGGRGSMAPAKSFSADKYRFYFHH